MKMKKSDCGIISICRPEFISGSDNKMLKRVHMKIFRERDDKFSSEVMQ